MGWLTPSFTKLRVALKVRMEPDWRMPFSVLQIRNTVPISCGSRRRHCPVEVLHLLRAASKGFGMCQILTGLVSVCLPGHELSLGPVSPPSSLHYTEMIVYGRSPVDDSEFHSECICTLQRFYYRGTVILSRARKRLPHIIITDEKGSGLIDFGGATSGRP